MKKLLGTDIKGSYTFNPAARTITFSNLASNISLENILLITNTTANTIIYTFAGGTLKGQTSFTNNVLTLDFNTTSMNASDVLQIYLDVDSVIFDETRSSLEDQIVLLRRIVKILESQSAIDSANRQRITIDTIAALVTPTSTSVPVSGTVTSNISQLAGRDQQLFSEWSRTAYNTGIRSQLTFS
jgi:hypothetical protein